MPFLVFLLYIFYRARSEKTRPKKEYYNDYDDYDERYKKVPSLFGNLWRANDHWEVVLDLKSALSLQVYIEVGYAIKRGPDRTNGPIVKIYSRCPIRVLVHFL